MDGDSDLLDEWLWPESCRELRDMESALRCLICGEFFHGPVLLPCGHTFCSECVRRFLQSRGAQGCCPECKQPSEANTLVPNRSLEKVGGLFKQIKPRLVPVLTQHSHLVAAPATSSASDTTSQRGVRSLGKAKSGGSKPPERMPLLSYSLMKDKDVKKLLESIGIRANIKNREDIIQIHKEYVLLANAQADSSMPKSASQVRDEVMRNYRARQQEKQSNGAVLSGRKSLDGSNGTAPSEGITNQMKANFEKLKRDIEARKAGGKAGRTAPHSTSAAIATPGAAGAPAVASGEGEWRHVVIVRTNQEFYIHSVTNEIRLEPPQEYLEQQRQSQQQEQSAAASASMEMDATPQPAPTEAPVSSVEQRDTERETGGDGSEDFAVEMMSLTPKPMKLSTLKTPSPAPSRHRGSSAKRPRSQQRGNESFFSPGGLSAATPNKFLTPTKQASPKPPVTVFLDDDDDDDDDGNDERADTQSVDSNVSGTTTQQAPDDAVDASSTQFSSQETVSKWECPRS
ncbi:hypothetical protein PINS_up002135 [Pythium insidiosum]|nr:hypothetical protein PINS_up002135 [Pythium insidiosum]